MDPVAPPRGWNEWIDPPVPKTKTYPKRVAKCWESDSSIQNTGDEDDGVDLESKWETLDPKSCASISHLGGTTNEVLKASWMLPHSSDPSSIEGIEFMRNFPHRRRFFPTGLSSGVNLSRPRVLTSALTAWLRVNGSFTASRLVGWARWNCAILLVMSNKCVVATWEVAFGCPIPWDAFIVETLEEQLFLLSRRMWCEPLDFIPSLYHVQHVQQLEWKLASTGNSENYAY